MAYPDFLGAVQCSPSQQLKQERNPDSISGRLDQLIYGLNGSLHSANQIQLKLWGPTPEPCGNAINQTAEPCVNVQVDMLQVKVSELQRVLDNILKAF